MTAIKQLESVQSDTKNYKISVIDGDGAAIDITGYKLFFTVKTKSTDSDAEALISKTVICPANSDSVGGIGFIPLTTSDTNVANGNYVYDLKIQNTTSTLRKTVITGKYQINKTVTQRLT